MGMRTTTTITVTAESFEKLFVRNAASTIGLYPKGWTSNEHLDLTDWRDIARKALDDKELGSVLLAAVLSLPVKYREVLFLRDVKNLGTEEAAWVLGITGGAVKAWLSRARALVREALTSALSSRLSNKCSNFGSFYCDFPASGSEPVAILR
jgi:DNA-directed RNA polymerase specialized sigma24 family protein